MTTVAYSKSFFRTLSIAVLGIAVIVAEAEAVGKGRGKLYSTAAVNGVCTVAQQLTASTDLEAQNSILSVWDDFSSSNASPYAIFNNNLEFTYELSEEPDLPLTTTQHVVHGLYGTGERSYPQVISCKMKSADYLVQSKMDENAVDKGCMVVHEFFVEEVLASLTNKERADVVIEPDEEIQIELDQQNFGGPAWTAGFPDTPYPVIYRESVDGPIHIRASSLLVSPDPAQEIIFGSSLFDFCNTRGGRIPGCQPAKWGVRYCHFAAPEYIREAITGGVEVPSNPPSIP